MQWLVLSYLISIGSVYNVVAVHDPLVYVQTPGCSIETTLGFEALIADHFFIGAQAETWETPAGNGFFSPFESLYRFSAGVRFSGFEAGFRHECDHETLSSFSAPTSGFAGGRTEFYVSYTGKVKVF